MRGDIDRASLGVILACAVCITCGSVEQEIKGAGADVVEVAYCPLADCGQVFLCTMPDGTQNEWCFPESDASAASEDSHAACVPTPRGGALGWPCLWHCDGGRGCDAYQGCWGCR